MTRSRPVLLSTRKQTGFTIVELLIVIVVIGILAAITIIAYTGVSQKAVEAGVKSNLSGAARLLASDLTLNGSYPTTTAAANGGKGLPASNGTTYSYTVDNSANPPTYTLVATNPGTSNNYAVTSTNSTPSIVANSAPVITTPASNVNFFTDNCGSAPAYYTFTLNSAGSGVPAPTIQWQRMTPINTTTGTWTNVSSGTSANLTFNATGVISDGSYNMFRVQYTNSVSTTTSSLYKVTIRNGC